MKIRAKKTNLILMILLAVITILLVSFMINLSVRNDDIISGKITTPIGKLEEEKVKMSVKIKEKLGNGIVYVLVKIESENEIESITFPNEDGTTITLTPQSEKRTIAKDLKVELKKEYNVTIKTKDGETVTKTILFEGDGTEEHPFIIRTKEELQAVNEDLSAYYILGANIDLTDFEFTPIGTSSAPFTGNIDGTGYTISKLNIDNEENDNIGLFSYNNGTISNITLNDITIKGKSNVGGLVGYNTGTVTGNTVSGNVTGVGDNVGGLIGQTTKGITNNISRANVNGQSNTGGLVGYVYLTNRSATLSGNVAEGKVIGTSNVGGLVGYNRAYTTSIANYRIYLKQSYATGNVEGKTNVGGLVGFQQAYASRGDVNSTSTINYIDQCYATGNIKATGNNAGGLVGYIDSVGEYHRSHDAWSQYANVVVQNSFATGKVEGASNIGGLIGYGIRRIVGAQCKAHIQIVNTYAIGEVTSTAESGQAGGLVGAISASGSGNTTVTNSYWTPETTKQETSVLGIKNLIPYMMRKIGYDSWDFEDIWKIEEGQTIAYLKNVQKPESVNKENITYEEFDVIGEGTEESPFIITHPVQLQKITDRLNAYYKLGANIDLTGRTWTPIGTTSAPFVGNIDGTGYIISNLNYDNEAGENVGLFGYNNGTLSNITLENVIIKGKTNAGGLVGYNTGTVTECIVKGNVTGLSDNVGLLIGYNSGSVTNNQTEGTVTGTGSNTGGLIGQTVTGISDNTSKAEVHGQTNTGGLVGYVYLTNKSATLSGNVAEGKVIGTSNVGGLIGYNRAYTTSIANYRIYLKQSYATGNVEGITNVGGLVGYQQSHAYRGDVNSTSTISYIDQCYATGNVTITGNNAGGLVGYIDSVGEYYRSHDAWSQYANIVVQNSFATGRVEGASNIGGLIGYGIRRIVGAQCQAYIQITNTYAIGEVVATEEAAKVGGLVGVVSSSGSGNTTATNSYWTPETTKQENSTLGTKNLIPYMMRKIGYENWDFETIWEIDELNTIAYLKNVQKPESVKKENITYEEFEVIGEGTSESPFIITTPVQLQKISEKLASYYKIGANIDLTGRTWMPIGTSAAPFTGNIDGTGYIISNLNYDNETGENVGLFGYNSGTISNITLENVTVKGKTNVGGLVGYNTGTVIGNTVKGNLTGVGDNIGILIGYNTGTVTNNQTEGVVTNTGNNTGGLIGQTIVGISGNTSRTEIHGQANTGGLVGYVYLTNRSDTLSGNVSEGKVIGTSNVGGLIGYNRAYTTSIANYRIYLQQSYATGNVEGANEVGGLVGYQQSYASRGDVNSTSTISYIDQCYATGNVSITGNNAGGLVGYIDSVGEYHRAHDAWSQHANVVIQNSYATGKIEGASNVGGLIGYGIRRVVGDQCQAYIQITNTYAIGEVIATGESAKIGGLVGLVAASGSGNTTATDSFWNTETTKQESSVLGTASNTEGMTGIELYTNWSSDIWTIEAGKYPKLNF